MVGHASSPTSPQMVFGYIGNSPYCGFQGAEVLHAVSVSVKLTQVLLMWYHPKKRSPWLFKGLVGWWNIWNFAYQKHGLDDKVWTNEPEAPDASCEARCISRYTGWGATNDTLGSWWAWATCAYDTTARQSQERQRRVGWKKKASDVKQQKGMVCGCVRMI